MDPVEKHNDHFQERAPPKEGHRQLTMMSALVLGLETVFLCILLLPCALLSTLWKLMPTKKKCLRDNVVLVTGAGRGLGKGLALGFAKQGCKVAVADINRVNAEQTAAEIVEAGGVAKAYCVNVAKVNEVKQLQKGIFEELGPVDILVNNAGLLNAEPLEDFTDDDISTIVAVNLTSHFWMVREFLPAMRKRNSGHIVAISSVAGFSGLANGSAYVATKFAVRGFMESIDAEMESYPDNKIKTTTAFPYFINTSADYMRTWDLRLPAIPVETAVEAIISGVTKDKKLIFVPGFLQYTLPWMQVIPTYLQGLVKRVYYIKVSSSRHTRTT